jgi:acetylornithine deacetylase/succinyl-diaminopimelate desuccinylase-like protein
LLRELIALPSVNPAFLPPGNPYAGEQRVGEFLAAHARRAGLDVEFQPVEPRRANLVARMSPRGQVRQRVLLAPHLDTVGGNEVPGALFTPRVTQGRLYGRGACDTKGSVAAMFLALAETARSGRRPLQTEIIFAGLVGEECGQNGSRALAASGFPADLAIVGEPTGLQVVTAHKGDLWLTLQTRGRAAHGARPELGRNAVHEMARVVDALETEYATRLRRRRHPLLGHATINVGTIRGGRQPNIVPDECVISIDRRTLPGESDLQVKSAILSFLRSQGLRARITATETPPCLALDTDPGLPLVQHLLSTAKQKQPAGVHYFSDAGVLGAAGIPSVLFGPGDIAQAHTADEWIAAAPTRAGQGPPASLLAIAPVK